MRQNRALAKWRAGEQTIGGWLSLANTHTAELLANAGFDWLCIDLQHGLLDYRRPAAHAAGHLDDGRDPDRAGGR